MKFLKRKTSKKEIIEKIFYATGTFLILIGILVLVEDMFKIIPSYIKAIILYLSAILILFISNLQKEVNK